MSSKRVKKPSTRSEYAKKMDKAASERAKPTPKWLNDEMDRIDYYMKMRKARKTGGPLPKRPKGLPEPLDDPLIYPKKKKK